MYNLREYLGIEVCNNPENPANAYTSIEKYSVLTKAIAEKIAFDSQASKAHSERVAAEGEDYTDYAEHLFCTVIDLIGPAVPEDWGFYTHHARDLLRAIEPMATASGVFYETAITVYWAYLVSHVINELPPSSLTDFKDDKLSSEFFHVCMGYANFLYVDGFLPETVLDTLPPSLLEESISLVANKLRNGTMSHSQLADFPESFREEILAMDLGL